ncbi:hypothetical protein ACZ87_02298 [Candidatus Erwinia dacicola]|uniref:Uncharacterized protein n=1 Tax=Candidatus Erwinia dacicola TaxID=252393 RepID=A0A328TK93_9GAMM|nr:hypothetical protein ACZ87_02298 [Candidatus Erwinia dacicola]
MHSCYFLKHHANTCDFIQSFLLAKSSGQSRIRVRFAHFIF